MAEAEHSSAVDGLNAHDHLTQARPYGRPRRVWVEDGHVFVETFEGAVVSMTPDVAIEMGRLIGNAGADSLVNKVMARNNASMTDANGRG